jgi:adenylate kinase
MIVLMGVAGSGKSMQGRMLADEAGYPWLSTGELLRVLITGRRRHEMLAGNLLSDEEVINVVNTVLGLIDTSQEFVLDGFPRTVAQADWVLNRAKEKHFELNAVFHLSASEETVKTRLIDRGRPDDTDDAIAIRFQEYHEVTVPIIEHFRKGNVPVFDIDASQPPEKVHLEIMHRLSQLKKD